MGVYAMEVEFNTQMDTRILNAVESIWDIDNLEDALHTFLPALLNIAHLSSADVFIFNKRKELVRIASCSAREEEKEYKEECVKPQEMMALGSGNASMSPDLPKTDAFVSIPLISERETQGFLCVELEPQAKSQRGLEQNLSFAGRQLAMKLRELGLKREKEKAICELRSLRVAHKTALNQVASLSKQIYIITAIFTKINQAMDTDKALDMCAKNIRAALDASGVLIFQRKVEAPRLQLSAMDAEESISKAFRKGGSYGQLGKDFLREIMASDKPMIRKGLFCFCGNGTEKKLRNREYTVASIPFIPKNVSIGAMVILKEGSYTVTQKDIRLLSGVAYLMALFIEHMRLYKKTEKEKRESAFLMDAVADFHETLNLKETLVSVAEKGAGVISGECDVYLFSETKIPVISVMLRKEGDEDKTTLHSKAFHQTKAGGFNEVYEWLKGYSKSMLIKNIRRSKKIEPNLYTFFAQRQIRSLMAIPINLARKKLGFLVLCRTTAGSSFTRHDLSMAEILAKAAAVAIQNANAYESSSEMSSFLEKKIKERTLQMRKIKKLQKERVERRNDIIFRVNRNNRFIFVNKAMVEITGVTRDMICGGGMKAEDLVAEVDRHKIREAFQEVLKGEKDIIQDLEYDHLGPGDEHRIISLTVYPEHDASGRIMGLEGVGRDITNQRRLEAELEKTKYLAMLGEFSGAIAHQIRNPLGDILMGFNILKRILGMHNPGGKTDEPVFAKDAPEEKDEGRLQRIFQDLSDAIHNLNQVITELLGYTRSLRLRTSLQNIQLMIEEPVDTMRSLISKNRIRVEKRFDPNLPAIPVDALLMAQVFQITLHNAIEAMPNGGVLFLSAGLSAEKPKHVEISIKDSGIGIDPAELPKIFRPFYTTKDSGIGLGLPFCSRIITAHRGMIYVTNNREKGVTVHIHLPFETENVSEGLIRERDIE